MVDRGPIPRDAEPVPDELPDTEMLVALMHALARKGQQERASPEMLPTLTGIENRPRPPELATGIDYGQPVTGRNALIGRLPTATFDSTPEGEAAATRGLQALSYPAGGRGLSPSMQERQDQAESGRAAAGLLTAGSALVPVEAMGMRGLQAAGNVAAPYLRAAGNMAARVPAATATAATGAALLAAPGEAEPPSELSRARDLAQKTRENRAKIEADQRQLRNEAKQFDSVNLKDAEAVKKAQAAVGTKPDGIWSEKTAAAVQAYRDRKNREADTLDKRLETLSRDLERQEREVTNAEGGERLRNSDQNIGTFNALLRTYGEPAATVLGIGTGLGSRWGLTRLANRSREGTAEAVEAMLKQNMSRVPRRTGRLNEIWRRGGASSEQMPFTPAPGTKYGVATNPNAAPSADLFPVPPVWRRQFTGADLGAEGVAGADVVYSELRKSQAENELAHAQDIARQDPSELNIARMQRALSEVAFWQSMSRFGQGTAGGYLAGTKFSHRHYPQPDLQQADAEMANLNRLINPPPRRRTRK
jgi:hypothetical protein